MSAVGTAARKDEEYVNFGYSFSVVESWHFVHGLSGDLVKADWPPIVPADIADLVSTLSNPPTFLNTEGFSTHLHETDIAILWQSPRPMSAAAVIKVGNKKLFVKRHHLDVRSISDLRHEHEFTTYLYDNSINVPFIYSDENGETAFEKGGFVYEFTDVFAGKDLYKDRVSWSYYMFPEHAYRAGKALARLHQVSKYFNGSAREFGPLCNSVEVITAENPLTKLEAIITERPSLARSILEVGSSLDMFFDRFTKVHLSYIEKLVEYGSMIQPSYTHGDWHPSNMSWSSGGKGAEVECVFDFGLSNLTFFQHDIAVAMERSCIDWLGIYDTDWDRDSLIAFLRGYDSIKKLSELDLAFIADILPVSHLEYALSELEYFGAVLAKPDNATLAYESYLFGHTEFFLSPKGVALRETVRHLKS